VPDDFDTDSYSDSYPNGKSDSNLYANSSAHRNSDTYRNANGYS
jgi:hypothetical protein